MKAERDRAVIVKLGGSVATNAEGVNVEFLRPYLEFLFSLHEYYGRLALVIGGGPRVRRLQAHVESPAEKDRMGIQVTRDHAQILNELAREVGFVTATKVPTTDREARILVADHQLESLAAGGLKIGQTTDAVAVTIAEMFVEEEYEVIILMLSNIAHIYTSDPALNSEAKPIRRANINHLIQEGVLSADKSQHVPGMHGALDQTAVAILAENFIPTFFGHINDTEDVARVISGQPPLSGTTLIGADEATEYYS